MTGPGVVCSLAVAVLGGGVRSQICWLGAFPGAICFLTELGGAVLGGGVCSQICLAGAFPEAYVPSLLQCLVVGCVLKSAAQSIPQAMFLDRAGCCSA